MSRIGLLLVLASLLVAAAYLAEVPKNPNAFFVDEASIAYNAQTISTNSADEHGNSLPLYFRAFGEYKSPVYIYLLAAVFRITGPSILVARLVSAGAGLAAASLLGLLAFHISGRRITGLITFLAAGLTPWFFEISRLVFEVALFPALLTLFLLVLYRASKRATWPIIFQLALGTLLGLMFYTYSAGRLLAPLFAVGLALFITRASWRSVLLTGFVFALTLTPLMFFSVRQPGVLSERFKHVTYVKPGDTRAEIVVRFAMNYVHNFSPRSWLLKGDPEPRHHLQAMGSILVGVALLALLGFVLILIKHWREAWWRFVIYGLAVSPVPASLTLDHFHTLRLIALPVFLVVLTVPAIDFLLNSKGNSPTARRLLMATLVLAIISQGAFFQWRFHTAALRVDAFDSYYPELLAKALDQPQRPVYLFDKTPAAYVYAFWYATLRGINIHDFKRIKGGESPPAGAVVISHELPCTNCEMIAERGQFRVYRQK